MVRQNKYSYEREKSALFIEQWQTLNLEQPSFICILGRGTIVLDGINVHLLAVVRSPAVMVLHHISEKYSAPDDAHSYRRNIVPSMLHL